MKRISLILCLLLCGAMNAQAQQIDGTTRSTRIDRVVGTIRINRGTIFTGNNFHIIFPYSRPALQTIASMSVPNHPNGQLSVNSIHATYHGDARQVVCIDPRSYTGNWRTLSGTMDLTVDRQQNGQWAVKVTFTPSAGPNAKYANTTQQTFSQAAAIFISICETRMEIRKVRQAALHGV